MKEEIKSKILLDAMRKFQDAIASVCPNEYPELGLVLSPKAVGAIRNEILSDLAVFYTPAPWEAKHSMEFAGIKIYVSDFDEPPPKRLALEQSGMSESEYLARTQLPHPHKFNGPGINVPIPTILDWKAMDRMPTVFSDLKVATFRKAVLPDLTTVWRFEG